MNTEKKTVQESNIHLLDVLLEMISLEADVCQLVIKEHVSMDAELDTLFKMRERLTGKVEKTSWLVEMVYAIHTLMTTEGSRITVKELVRLFEFVFGVELKNFYDTYNTLRSLVKDRTPFLSMLRRLLLRRMDELDK